MGRDDIPNDMIFAARDGDVKALQKVLADGTDPNASNVIGQTAMHFAAMWGQLGAVVALLDAGADANVENDNGATPLFYAVRKGQVEVVETLLARGAKLREMRKMFKDVGDTPRVEEMTALLQSHYKPNDLTLAIKTLDLNRLRSLLDAGMLTDSDSWEDLRGRTPFHYAVMGVVATVEQRAEDEERFGDPFGPSDALTALELLVQAAVKAGDGALREACDQLADDGYGALHLLAKAGHAAHPVALRLLLEAGADPNVQSLPETGEYTSGQWGRTTATGEKEVLSVSPDRTPLHITLEADEPSKTLLTTLLEHGVRPREGSNTLDWADAPVLSPQCACEHAVAEHIRRVGCCTSPHVALIRPLFEPTCGQADPNVRDAQQRTALHLALDFDEDRGGIQLETIRTLLSSNADPSLGSAEIGADNTCLHAAVLHNEVGLVKLLLTHGAPHSAPGKGGWTPLALAARGGAVGIVQALLAAGADADAPTPVGKSARELAAVNNKAAVLEALESTPVPAG